MAITTTTDHTPGDRFRYDLNLPGDFAQLLTSEDASHYGNWASAQHRILFSYCEVGGAGGEGTVQLLYAKP
jgi:hypothetical protein